VGEVATITKAQYLHGSYGRRCGRHKCEGHAYYLGRSVTLPKATDAVKYQDGGTEVSRCRSRLDTANRRAEHRLWFGAC